MKARKIIMVCMTLLMGSQATLLAQEAPKPEKKRPTREQMQQMQCNHLIETLALDDATAAKFAPVYRNYLEEMRAVRKAGSQEKAGKDVRPRPLPTDADVEAAIRARFAQSRQMLDIRERYYNEFRKFLSPKQIQKIYNLEKNNGERFRKEASRRQGMKRRDGGRKLPPAATRTAGKQPGEEIPQEPPRERPGYPQPHGHVQHLHLDAVQHVRDASYFLHLRMYPPVPAPQGHGPGDVVFVADPGKPRRPQGARSAPVFTCHALASFQKSFRGSFSRRM